MRDSVVASGAWQFDAEVTDAFEDMLSRSIPNFLGMREAVARVSKEIAPSVGRARVLDLGASRGDSIAALEASMTGIYTAVENAPAMLEVLRERFDDRVEIVDADLRDYVPPRTAFDLVLSVLTVQFTPIEYRHAILRRVYDALDTAGGFVFVEKVLATNARLDRILTNAYYEMKRDNGYTAEQIDAKRRSLEGVLVPVTAEMNESLLRAAGFSDVEMIWRSGPFAGWVALK